MIEPDKRKAIFLLHEEGMGLRQIAKSLKVSRNTVRSIIGEKGAALAKVRKDKVVIDQEILARLYRECDGFIQRVHEKLVEEEKIEIKYSTLTRMIRELGLGQEISKRCGSVPDQPGQEMQHDTSPYQVKFGDRGVKVVASSLYLRYSKRRYVKFYHRFDRFRMKCFFHEALMHFGHSAPICVIDNTNLARLRGIGRNAVMVAEMAAFAKQYGFEFLCHEKGHSNRKAGEERGFWTIETNFFPGRTFESLEDMNAQALEWATVRMYQRPVGKAGLIPAKAFEHEQTHLTVLQAHLPAPHRRHERGTDQYGFVAFDGNYYFVPGTRRDDLSVFEFSDQLKIYRQRELLIEYRLPPDGTKNTRFYPEGSPTPRYAPKSQRNPTTEEEKRLRGIGTVVGVWLDFALEPGGIARHRAIRELFQLSRQVTEALFLRAVERAVKYRIRPVETIRRIALMHLTEDVNPLPSTEVDETFLLRDAYVEGRLTDAPDFSTWLDQREADESHG